MTPVKAGRSGSDRNAAEVLLLRRVAERDSGAFEELFEDYYSRLFSFLFRLTRSHGGAEELANDVLLTLWKDAGRFRGESRVSTWIFGIAYRQALAHLRKRKLKLVPFKDDIEFSSENDKNIEREDWVRHAIDALPPKQKLTVMLVYFLGLSCEETAGVTGVGVNTVKTRMFHARRKLELHLIENGSPQNGRKDVKDD
jgi:RNA polymerase sigma-70 factor (ECF subfamily)